MAAAAASEGCTLKRLVPLGRLHATRLPWSSSQRKVTAATILPDTGIQSPSRWTTREVAARFLLGFFCLLLKCMSCLYVLEMKHLLVSSLANIFSQSVGHLFILFMVSFVVQKLVSLIRSHLFIFACISIASDKAFLKNCFKYVEGENGKYDKIVKKNT